MLRRIGGGAAHLIAILACATATAAEHDLLDAPAPPTLPALAHRSLTVTLELTTASIEPQLRPPRATGRAYSWLAHSEAEYPIVPREWYVGVAQDVAAGSVPGVGNSIFLGNPELWVRGLWSSVLGLSSGGGLGVVIPIPREVSTSEHLVLDTIRVVRPWDAPYFSTLTVTLRPWIDVRHMTGRFMLQFRQALDIGIATRSLAEGEHRTDLVARGTFYVGFRIVKAVGVGLELWEVYQITAEVADDRRAAFGISPSVRFLFPHVEPSFSVLLPLTTPLRGEAASYYAARLNVAFNFDASGL
jgi:hypothetical protein